MNRLAFYVGSRKNKRVAGKNRFTYYEHGMNTAGKEKDMGLDALSDALRISFRLLRYLMCFVLGLYLISGIFVVEQHEKVFVLHFGKIAGSGADRIKGPGIHWTWPKPFSEFVRISTERIQTVHFNAFWFTQEEGSPPNKTLAPGRDGYTLSGDANLMHSNWALRYTISDPESYAFSFSDVDNVLRLLLQDVVVKTTGHYSIDGALRNEIGALAAEVEREMRNACDKLNLGLRIQGVDLLGILPPLQVKDAFVQVIHSEQEMDAKVRDAEQYNITTLNQLLGEKQRTLAEGRSSKQRIISEAKAHANYFEQVYKKYVQNPEVIKQTLLQDTLRRTFASLEEKYVVDQKEGKVQLYLNPEQEKE